MANIAAKKSIYQDNIRDCAYVLAKACLDFILSKAITANFSQSTVETAINTDSDTLGAIRKKMNVVNGGALPRAGIVNSDVFETLDSDTRIISRDVYGQATGGVPLGHLTNVKGFSDVWEYPGLPSNAQNLSGFFFDPRAVAVVFGLPDHNFNLAEELGLPMVMKQEISSSMSFASVMFRPHSFIQSGMFNWITPQSGIIATSPTVCILRITVLQNLLGPIGFGKLNAVGLF